jgi:Mce-associated membrane protein
MTPTSDETAADTIGLSLEKTATQVPETLPSTTEANRRRAMSGTALLVAAALVVAAFVAANVWLYVERSNSDGSTAASGSYPINGAEPAAMTSARERIPAMLSYKYTNVDSYIATAPDNATGQFKKDFTELITRVIAPAARAQKIVTTAQVKSVGVIEAHSDSVTVLVMLDQTTTSKKTKGARVDGSRVRVVMTLTGGKWLVSSLTPI